jgi:uncharacterized membrane protein
VEFRTIASGRRLATLLSLLALTGFCFAMVAARVAYTGTSDYVNLIWNLVLAWIPFLVALFVYDAERRSAPRAHLLAGAGVWRLFFPNAPYLVTDLGHLRSHVGAPLWFDVVLVSTAGWAGLALGFVSLYLVHSVGGRLLGVVNAWLLVLVALALSSFGIYLGRFERWNSWDVVAQPKGLLVAIARGVADPLAHPRTIAVTALFTVFLSLIYLVCYSFARLAVGEPGAHEQ